MAMEARKLIRFSEIRVNSKNEMSMDEKKISQIAQNIEYIGLLDPPVVYETTDGYVLLSGETRYRAIAKLREAGKWRPDDMVEVFVKDLDSIEVPIDRELKEMLVLLSGNMNREKTDADRAFEIKNWKKIIAACRKAGIDILYMADSKGQKSDEGIRIAGRKTREIIAEQTHMSRALVGQYEQVENRGTEMLKEALLSNRIPVNVAVKVSGLNPDEQDDLLLMTLHDQSEDKRITQKDVREYYREKLAKEDSYRIMDAQGWREMLQPLYNCVDQESFKTRLTEADCQKIKKKIQELTKLVSDLKS